MQLSEEQIKNGYWYHNPDGNFPPKGKVLNEYRGEESLGLFCTKGNKTYAQINNREITYKKEIPNKLSS